MIIVRKNILSFNDTSFKCAIGKNGVSNNKVEGDGCTPAGTFSLGQIYYRKDRIVLPNLNILTTVIERRFGWCDDINSQNYNKIISFPFKQSAEILFREDNIYDILCVINYNQNPVIKNKGSAIFLHIAKDNYSGTEGCIAINKEDLIQLLSKITAKTNIKIIN